MYNSDNEKIYYPRFALYTERSSPADANRKSYHLTAFELINPLLYVNFQNFECTIFFFKDLKFVLSSSVAL